MSATDGQGKTGRLRHQQALHSLRISTGGRIQTKTTSQPSTDQLVSNTGEELLKFGQASSRRGDLSWNNGKQRAEHMRRTTWLTSTLEVARFKQRSCWLN